MKIIKNLSLFFLFLLCVGTGSGFSQTIDSTSYWSGLILSPKKEGDLAKGYLHFAKARDLNLKQNNTRDLIYSSGMLSIAEFELGAYHKSKNSAITALKLVDESKIDKWTFKVIPSIYNSLGKAHKELKDYERAIESYDNVLRLSENISDSIAVYINRANVYREEGNFDQALSELSTANRLIFRNPKATQNARVLNNLGYVQFKLDKAEAIKNMLKGLEIRISEEDTKGTFSSYMSLLAYYNEKGNKDSAKIYVNKALDLSEKIDSPIYKKEAISNLLKLEGNPWLLEYLKIDDELKKNRLEQDVKFSHLKYDVEKEREIALKQKLEGDAKNKLQMLIFSGIGIILLVIAILLYSFLRSKHKREKVQQVIKTETRISKKVHDELANGIHAIMTRLQRELPKEVQEKIIDELDIIYKKTRNISHDISAVSGREKYHIEIKDMLGVYQKEDRVIMIKGLTPALWVGVAKYKKGTLYHVLREIMVNMDKHSQATIIIVTFKKENRKIIIDYMDNGVGFSKNHLSKGIGLQNTENRIKTIGGTCTFNSTKGKGARITISFSI
ncbi:tetratricopeptide repeat protein [Dokdonia ponticola]|uniref:histidine kinase n=1 Tax=Dokdonia ponticola TaxID=2041041 RepID=A0ABV9HTV9_9FLAO